MTFKAKQLVVQLAPNPPPLPSLKGVKFGTLFSPHMVEIDAEQSTWGVPHIIPFKNFSIPPQMSCLHYGLQCFEGLKAYRDASGNVRLFRPDRNCERMFNSMQRLCFPYFDTNELLEVIKAYVRVEKNYVPSERGFSLYIRPTAIGTSVHLSAVPSTSTKLFIIASPVGPYYASGLKPVRLLVEEERRRAAPGGTGSFKIGANYAGPMLVQRDAVKRGYEQVLWLSESGRIQEVGAMNFFCLWRRSKSSSDLELITPPLDGTILPGVTRDSILTLARKMGTMKVSEEYFTIHDLVAALKEGRVVECFGCGTAAVVSPVNTLHFAGVDYDIPCPEPSKSFTHTMLNDINDIQYGVVDSEWSVVV